MSVRKKIVITGAAGLVGSYLWRHLEADCDLFLACLPEEADRLKTETNRSSVIACDLSQSGFTSRFPSQVDHAIHLAQSPFYRIFPKEGAHLFGVNGQAVAELLDWAVRAGARSALVASTGSVYPPSPEPLEEGTPIDLLQVGGGYARSKLAGELAAGAFAEKLPVQVVRPFFIYGPGQSPTMLIPRLIESVREGRPLQLQGEDGMRLNPIYVADAVCAIVRALELQESWVINLAGPHIHTLRDLGDTIGRAMGKAALYTSDLSVNSPSIVGCTERMTRLLGPSQTYFEEGVARLIP